MSHYLHQLAPLAAGSLIGAGVFGKLFPSRVGANSLISFAYLAAGFTLLALGVARPAAGPWLTDATGLSVAAAVALITGAVLRFCVRHLDGYSGKSALMTQISLVSGSVILFMVSGHLLVAWVAWAAAGLFVHALLSHDGRPEAVFIARKKFLIARLSDVLLAVAFWQMYKVHGTADIGAILARPELTPASAAWLVLAAAIIRSAQAPFHTWLPETMEVPAPVSAMMHAGIVNAGGFLVIRFAPMLAEHPATLNTLAPIGALTAVYGLVCAGVQPEVKRSLAYSTVAQMGFLMMACGLGAFGAATLHLIAHALYKADAFLSAGDTVALPRACRPPVALTLAVTLAAAAAAGAAATSAGLGRADGVLLALYAVALAYGAVRCTHGRPPARAATVALGAGAALAASWWLLHRLGETLSPQVSHEPAAWAVGAALAPVLMLPVLQALCSRSGGFSCAFKTHARHGFYLNTIISRRLGFLRPRRDNQTSF